MIGEGNALAANGELKDDAKRRELGDGAEDSGYSLNSGLSPCDPSSACECREDRPGRFSRGDLS